jgi:hypothetical protein
MGNGEFRLDPSQSTATAKRVEDFYQDLDSEFTNAEFLKFNLKGLVALATSRDNRGRSWLSDYLRQSPDTPECRQLKTLLAPVRQAYQPIFVIRSRMIALYSLIRAGLRRRGDGKMAARRAACSRSTRAAAM